MSLHQPHPHDSARLHVTGEALYIDDIPLPAGTLHGAFGLSQAAHARFSLDLSAVRAAKGVRLVLTAADLPHNDISPVGKNDDPILADEITHFHGQPLFLCIAQTRDDARRACLLAQVTYTPLEAIVTLDAAVAQPKLVTEPLTLQRGEKGLTENTLNGTFRSGQQDHFYLETHVALAIPSEAGMHIFSSTQHPSEVQHIVAHVLGRSQAEVSVEVRRMGGGFGGKETQSNLFAAAAAIGAVKLNCPVKIRPSRDDDMIMTGKRHDFRTDYRIGFTKSGAVTSVEASFAARAGFSADLSGPITDRALFHVDNCYFYPHVRVTSLPLFTNTVSNTAFRGFGGPQGMIVAEQIIERVAQECGMDALDVRYQNLYRAGRDATPYHQVIDDFGFLDILRDLETRAQYRQRRQEVDAFNAAHHDFKKGLALTPVKFGISFTATWYNQAGALIHLYQDGSILVNHGGTEMGQGLFTKVAQIVAHCFGVPLGQVQVSSTRTDKVPNTSATAASSGADLNGKAAENAALAIKARLVDFIKTQWGEENPVFQNGLVRIKGQDMPFASLTKAAYLARVQLSAAGFYKTPDIHWDRASGRGNPFYYFACGAACSEVTIDCKTGEMVLERVDILHEAGSSLNPAIDRGQIEGGYIQGLGWLTTEEVVYSDKGKLLTHAPSTYKIPLATNRPKIWNVDFVQKPNSKDTIHKSKAVGEPPLMLAISTFCAINDAVMASAGRRHFSTLNAPATPEAILMALEALKTR
jgi:xanthine dehydrogenase large subunit